MVEKPHLYKIFKYYEMNKTAAKPIINALLKFIKMRTKYFKNSKIYYGSGLIYNLPLGTGLINLQN